MTENEKKSETGDKKDTELSIGERIQKKRKEHGLTVEQLIEVILRYDRETDSESEKGISVSSLYLYEKGDRLPRAKEIKLLCYSLDVSADWLLFGEAWNSQQDEDSKLAADFRALVRKANDENGIKLMFEKTASRSKNHRQIIDDVKFKN